MKKIISTLLLTAISFSGFAQVKVALKCDIGTYLSVCIACQKINGSESSSFRTAMLHGGNPNDWYSHFTMTRLENGNYVFVDDNGEYMSLCSGCIAGGTTPDFITFHTRRVEHYNNNKARIISGFIIIRK